VTHPADTIPVTHKVIQQPSSEIWVGYSSGDRHFIDMVEAPGNAEMKLRGLRAWWEGQISVWTRLVHYFVFCLRPCVLIGSLPFVSPIGQGYMPPLTVEGY
jgi:hypothetical protein